MNVCRYEVNQKVCGRSDCRKKSQKQQGLTQKKIVWK